MENKTIIITGAAGEIGFAAAKRFAKAGANVMLVDIDKKALQQRVGELDSPKIAFFAADVTKEGDVQGYVEATQSAFGSIDLFFNNAGIEGKVAPLNALDMEDFDRVMKVNVYGVAMGMKHVSPEISDGGSIVITSSVAGLQGIPGMTAYNTTKHAVVGIMRTAALELADRKVRVNTVHPGVIESRMMRSLESGMGDQQAVHDGLEQQVPLKRYGQKEEVAEMVFFLLSDNAGYCNGSTYVMDGGLLL